MKILLLVLGLFIAVQAKSSKRQNVPLAVPASSSSVLPPDKKLVCRLDFSSQQGKVVVDTSGQANNGYLMGGSILLNFQQGKCGNAAYLYCGEIGFHGDTFQGKPYVAVTIAAWINLKEVTDKKNSIFDTIGSTHGCGQYHFEVDDGNVRWFHRNESQITIFSNTAEGKLIKPDTWTHVAGTYDSASGKSKVYINGVLRNMTIGSGLLSRDWLRRAGIGLQQADRGFKGFIDDFRIYNYALNKGEITALAKECQLLPKAPASGNKKKPFADLSAPVYGDTPIDAATAADDYLPLKPSSDANRKTAVNSDSVEEAVLKRSHMEHKH